VEEIGNVMRIVTTKPARCMHPAMYKYSAEDAEVQAVCAAVHTPEIVAAYQAHLDNQGNN
jgi:hypothetical protein